MTAIIDGMGSCGAALGPLLTGYLSQRAGGFDNVFLMLYIASLGAAALLLRLVLREVRHYMRAHLPDMHLMMYSSQCLRALSATNRGQRHILIAQRSLLLQRPCLCGLRIISVQSSSPSLHASVFHGMPGSRFRDQGFIVAGPGTSEIRC